MNSSSPKISVIVPNYNHARFIEKRILSILNQTYPNFEIIFLDDASTDNSLEIAKKFYIELFDFEAAQQLLAKEVNKHTS